MEEQSRWFSTTTWERSDRWVSFFIVFRVLCLCPQHDDIEAFMFCRFLCVSKLREVVVFVSSKCIEIILHLYIIARET